MKNILFTLFLTLIALSLSAQAPQDWFHMSSEDGYNGVSSNKAYESLLNGKNSQTVVVAIIDSGVDIEHEDLKDVIWVNKDEIAGNGKDDDNNGYIDDVHGWNFIGGANGNVNHDTYEVTRLYGKLKYKYDQADESKLSKAQLKEYKLFKKYKAEVEEKRENATTRLGKYNESKSTVMSAINAVEKALGGKPLIKENIDSLDGTSDPNLMVGKNMVLEAMAEGQELESINSLKEEVESQFKGAIDHFQGQLDYAYNPDFNPRTIVGDNYEDSYEKGYGNNDVEGPDALHGTHVAGIVAASRNNDVGMDGVADNVEIMSIRTVPNGDERDKDVANAIIYAVDNGASIINMSFGKGYGTDKKAVDAAVKYAAKKDVLLVHAAGNAGQDNDIADNFPHDKYAKKKLFCSKVAKNWMEIGALNYNKGENLAAPFSNYGKNNVDIFAPGMAIYATVPDDGYQNLQGTSMAAPVVAGVAALVRSYYPSLTAVQVKEILMASSTKMTEQVLIPGSKEDKTSFSNLSVSGGVVNAYEALKLAAATKGKKKMKKGSNRA